MRILTTIALLVLCASSAHAQEGAATAPPAPSCPPSGRYPPLYGTFGDNDGVTRAYEIASPCTPKIVRDASEAIGLGRYVPLGIKNVTTIRFWSEGKLADANGHLKNAKVDVGISYVFPGIRMVIDRDGGRLADEIRVFANGKAWNEMQPGVGDVPSSATDREVLIKLTPFGGLWSVIEAEGNVAVSTAGGLTTIAGASPYDGIPVSVTLDSKNLPIRVEAKANGKSYVASFADYSDRWESPYLVIFPERVTWTIDDRPFADLTTTAFKSNPYVVFPAPAKAPKR